MINICCVRTGTKFSFEYVEKLYNMIKRNTTKEFQLYCLTDQKEQHKNIINIKIDKVFNSWWDKLNLFNKELMPIKEFFYFDLDTLIIKNIDDLLEYKGKFAILQNFSTKVKINTAKYGSALFYKPEDMNENIWENFLNEANNIMKRNQKIGLGDQRYLQEQIPNAILFQDIFDNKDYFRSTKYPKTLWQVEDIPENTHILFLHGKEKNHNFIMNSTSIQRYWK